MCVRVGVVERGVACWECSRGGEHAVGCAEVGDRGAPFVEAGGVGGGHVFFYDGDVFLGRKRGVSQGVDKGGGGGVDGIGSGRCVGKG